MQDSHNYLGQITANMSEDVVKDVVHKAIGSNWKFLTKLEMWTHYDNALSHQEDLALDKNSPICSGHMKPPVMLPHHYPQAFQPQAWTYHVLGPHSL